MVNKLKNLLYIKYNQFLLFYKLYSYSSCHDFENNYFKAMRYHKRPGKTGLPLPFQPVRNKRPEFTRPPVAAAQGTMVRSGYEKKAVAYFHTQNIRYVYEPLLLLDGKKYLPDFYLPDYNLFLEICGYGHMPHYRDRLTFKKLLYRKHQLKVIFIHYNGRGSLEQKIRKELELFINKRESFKS